MKYLKIFTMMLGILTLAACSNDDDKRSINNKGDVYVSMAQADITYKENKGVVTIPVTVTGERNGDITVTCTVEEYFAQGYEPAMEDVHYLLSSETITIWPEDNSGNFEVRLVDDRIMNDARLFVIKLVSANGAQLGSLLETIVTIKDNDQEPYDRIGGTWTALTASGATVGNVTFEGADDESEEGYNSFFYLILPTNYMANDPTILVKFNYVTGNETGTLSINFENQELGECSDGTTTTSNVLIGYLDADNYIQTGGEVVLEWTEDFSEIYVKDSPQGDGTAAIATFAYFDSWYYWAYIGSFSRLVQM